MWASAPRLMLPAIGIVLIAAAGAPAGEFAPALRAEYDLTKMWQIASDDDQVTIGHIADAVSDDRGRLYLLDAQLCRVLVLNPSGSVAREIGREGEGPGEFRQPTSIAWWAGDTLAVSQGAIPGRITLLDTLGAFVRTIHYSRNGQQRVAGIRRLAPYSSGMYLETRVTRSDGTSTETITELVRCDRNGAEMEVLRQQRERTTIKPYTLDEQALFVPWSEWAVLDDGFLVHRASRKEYRLRAVSPSGYEGDFAVRPYSTLSRDARDLERLRAAWLEDARRFFPDARVHLEETEPDIVRVIATAGGTLLVQTSRQERKSSGTTLLLADRYDVAGNRLGEVAYMTAQPEGLNDIIFVSGDTVLARHLVGPLGEPIDTAADCGGCSPVYVCYRARLRAGADR